MIGFPITYGDNLDDANFSSETLFTMISDYCSSQQTKEEFCKGYKFGLLSFGIASLFLRSTPAFAADPLTTSGSTSGTLTNNGAGSCPGAGSGPAGAPGPAPAPGPGPVPGPPTPGSLANVPTADRGVYAASALGICGIAMKSGAFYIGFICAAAVIVGVHMAGVPANAAL